MNAVLERLTEAEWRAQKAAHEARVDGLLGDELSRRSEGRKHPVQDFLFEYYRFRPARLRRWTPGIGVVLEGGGELLEGPWFVETEEVAHGVTLKSLPEKRKRAAAWILELLRNTAGRRPMFGCYGLHEWAMVYEEEDVRHTQMGLRLPHSEVRKVVEQMPIRCSHFDAFRFFSQSARDFNQLKPEAEERQDFEQPGCLHANMDLYKWGFKLSPWVASQLLVDCFEFAMAVREVDMRASPYDVTSLGYEPIKIETVEGRAAYERAQREFADQGIPLRAQLMNAIERVISMGD